MDAGEDARIPTTKSTSMQMTKEFVFSVGFLRISLRSLPLKALLTWTGEGARCSTIFMRILLLCNQFGQQKRSRCGHSADDHSLKRAA
jgi:hypothetical protein